jgi:hypothetical protein
MVADTYAPLLLDLFKPLRSGSILRLPPEQKGKMSLEEALARRRSVREFTRGALTERELSQLLWAAQVPRQPVLSTIT